MNASQNEWIPFLQSLKRKISPESRRMLLARMIGELQDITQQNFGDEGIDRPQEWPSLSPKYAAEYKDGDTNPTLMLSDEKHNLRNRNLPHLIDSFRTLVNENKAELTNLSPYADAHQLGLGIPARPYYPVNVNGNDLTPFAAERMVQIVNSHFEL